MSSAAGHALDSWDALDDGRQILLDEEILHIGLDTVGRALVSDDFSGEAKLVENAISGALNEIGEMSRRPPALMFQDVEKVGIVRAARYGTPGHWKKYLEHTAAFESAITSRVDDRIDNGHGDRDDLLRLLMETVDDETGDRLDRRQVIDEIKTFISAGHETTAHGLTWMFLLLANHPDALARLHEEVDQVLGGEPPTAETAEQLVWLAACFQEAMRIYPPVWHLPRLARNDDVLCGYKVPAGTRVLVSVWSTHRDPSVYPDPESFRPERWLDDAPKSRPRFSYLPFGGGRRACVGQGFAILNAQILGAMIAQRYSFEPDGTAPVKLEFTITTRPRNGVPMLARRRAPRKVKVAA
jgi:cytochrome P450